MPIDILRGSRVSCSKLKLGNFSVSLLNVICLIFSSVLVALVSCTFHYALSICILAYYRSVSFSKKNLLHYSLYSIFFISYVIFSLGWILLSI